MILPPKQKKHIKRPFWTKQKHHTKDYWNPKKVIFLLLNFSLLKGVFFVLAVFGLFCDGLIISTLLFILGHIFQHLVLKSEKYESLYIFSFFVLKNQSPFF